MSDSARTFSDSQKKAFALAFLRAIMLNDRSLGQDEMNHLYRIFSRLSIESSERQEVVYRATLEPQGIIDDISISSMDQKVKEQLLIEIFSYLDTVSSRKVVLDEIRKEFSDDQISSLQQEGQRRNSHFRCFKKKEAEIREKYDGISADQPEISDDGFWKKIKSVLKRVGKKAAPLVRQVLALWYCFIDPKTPKKIKAALAVPLLYFINPFDVILDFIPIFGYTDDAGVIAAAVSLFAFYLKKRHYQQADEKMREWFNEEYESTDKPSEPDSADEMIEEEEIGRIFSYADTDQKAFEEKRRSETDHLRGIAFDKIIDYLRHIADAYRI